MAIDRRRLILAGGAAALFAPRTGFSTPAARYVSAFKEADGYGAALLDEDGVEVDVIRLAGRGHGAAAAPRSKTAVLFARRPGRFAMAIDLSGRRPPSMFAPPPGRAFNGHGFFSTDERRLYATENAYDDGEGVLGVYDATAAFQRVDERPAGGVGPHEAILLADGRRAAVAVGGIETHPDFPRRKLNLPTMRPALAIVDLASGAIVARNAPPAAMRKLSVRHIARDRDGAVWFGGQWEGDPTAPPPLIGRMDRRGALAFIDAPAALSRAFRGYVGSVAASADGRRVLATSPRGGVAALIDTDSGRLLKTWRAPDVCGAAPGGDGLIATGGDGAFYRDGARVRRGPRAWDNHIFRIG